MITLAKTYAGAGVARLLPQCNFTSSMFLIGHMRCGSTALSAIICSRPEVSGYGEAHIAYTDRGALGVLALNQFRRKAWTGSANTLFDKILHSRYDAEACDGFFTARALFMARAPEQTIHSIRNLFATVGSGEYATDAAAADYYEERMQAMLRAWPKFGARRRAAMTYEALTADPEEGLARVSRQLGFEPRLANSYAIKTAAAARGAGDPLSAPRHTRIVAAKGEGTAKRALDITPDRLEALNQLYRQFCALG